MNYRVNVSAVNQYMRCPFRWWAQYVMDYVPRREAEPLVFGRLLHEVFEQCHKLGNMEVALDKCRTEWHEKATFCDDEFERSMRFNAIQQLKDLAEPLSLWRDKYTMTTLAVEEPFEVPHPMDDTIILVGRPDRVVLIDNKFIWHVQNRGLNSSTNFGVYCDLAKRHYHEHVYAHALALKYTNDIQAHWCLNCYKARDTFRYGGTIFNLVRKLKYRTGVTEKNPEGKVKTLDEMFYQFPMSIDLKSELHKHVMESLLAWIYKMKAEELRWELDGTIPKPNDLANGGLYGNSPDDYFRVLTGEIELGDERYFKTRIDPYERKDDAILQD